MSYMGLIYLLTYLTFSNLSGLLHCQCDSKCPRCVKVCTYNDSKKFTLGTRLMTCEASMVLVFVRY